LRDLRVHRVEVGGAGAAHGAAGRLALGHVAAHVALEAVEPLSYAPDLILHVRRNAFDVALILGLTKAARAGREDLLLRNVAVSTAVRLVTVTVGLAVGGTVSVGLIRSALVEVLEEGVDGLILALASASRIWSPMARMLSIAPGGKMLLMTSSITPAVMTV